MTTSIQHTLPSQAERREQQIKAHKEEVARLRADLGDPQLALFRFMTEHFEWQAVIQVLPPPGDEGRAIWEDDDGRDAW